MGICERVLQCQGLEFPGGGANDKLAHRAGLWRSVVVQDLGAQHGEDKATLEEQVAADKPAAEAEASGCSPVGAVEVA